MKKGKAKAGQPLPAGGGEPRDKEPATPLPAGAVDKVVLWIVAGGAAERLRSACAGELRLSESDTDAVIAEARRRLTVAATTVHDEEIGKALMRLNDLYARSLLKKDFRSALDAQRELNRLLALSVGPGEVSPDADLRAEVGRAMAHLVPLGLTKDKDVSIGELCRLAASRIVNLEEHR